MRGEMRNRGYSIIELVVALLVLGILTGGLIAGFSSVSNAKVDSAASNIMNALKQTRVKATSLINDEYSPGKPSDGEFERTQVYAKFYMSGSNYYVDICYDNIELVADEGGGESSMNVISTDVLYTEKISNDRISYTFKHHSDSIARSLGATNSEVIRIYFKKTTGGIKCITASGPDVSGKKADETSLRDGSDNIVDKIHLENTNKNINIALVTVTGRAFLDDVD